MKTFHIYIAFIIISFGITSCSTNDDLVVLANPVQNLTKIYDFEELDHSIEIYTTKSVLEIGYNEISIRIKDKATQQYVSDADVECTPMMHMMMMQHSAPHSAFENTVNATVYTGYVVFQMADNDSEFWTLNVNYLFNGQHIESSRTVAVHAPQNGLTTTQVFTGSDNVRYILAYVNPVLPQVATNNFTAVLYKMNSMMDFSVVENYKVIVDPRMPGMGNHSSPNNQDLIFNPLTKMYDGKLSLTMTGYWKVNLQLLNANNEILKGEVVTDDIESSSLYFELEF